MNEVLVARLVRRIAHTLEQEIDCGECSKLSPQYIDALLDGRDRLDRWDLVRVHLDQCTVCAQELTVLFQVVQMDREDTWPSVAVLLEWATRGESQA